MSLNTPRARWVSNSTWAFGTVCGLQNSECIRWDGRMQFYQCSHVHSLRQCGKFQTTTASILLATYIPTSATANKMSLPCRESCLKKQNVPCIRVKISGRVMQTGWYSIRIKLNGWIWHWKRVGRRSNMRNYFSPITDPWQLLPSSILPASPIGGSAASTEALNISNVWWEENVIKQQN